MGRFSARQEQANLHEAMLFGYCLDKLPPSVRHKVLKEAERLGWIEEHFYTSKHLRILLQAGMNVLADMLTQDHTTGRHELDLLTHRWATYLNIRKVLLRSTVKARIRTRSAAKNSRRQNRNSPGTGRRSKSLDSSVKT